MIHLQNYCHKVVYDISEVEFRSIVRMDTRCNFVVRNVEILLRAMYYVVFALCVSALGFTREK